MLQLSGTVEAARSYLPANGPQALTGKTFPTRVPQRIKSYLKGNTKRRAESEGDWLMDSAQHCHDQAAEYHRLMEKAQNEYEARLLANISQSWLRVAGQIDRYHEIMRQLGRIVRNDAAAVPQEKAAAGG
jgi:hypothetical protein